MKTYVRMGLLTWIVIFFTAACSYLDVVPDETPEEKDAFQNPTMAERYLYSCYSFLPDPRHETASLDLLTADEVVTPWEHETFANFPKGNYNASDPVISYWNTLFGGIRRCYLLLENIDGVPNMTEANLRTYKGEAKFLIAYYHFLLLKNYGPIPLIKGVLPIDMDKADFPERESYDVCVEWISDLFDEASTLLPAEQTSTAYGRATSVAAKALKSRLWLYAASPLFNGNSEYYADFVSKVDGRHLISQTYSAAKWERAATAAEEAISAATDAGYKLYTESPVGTSKFAQPTDPTQRVLRLNFIDYSTSKEVLWADTRLEGHYGLQYKSTPYRVGPSSGNGVGVTLTMVEMFYTKNGLPIDLDPEYDYAGRYRYGEYHNEFCDGVTLNLNIGREPRFYAWVAFQNGYYEVLRRDASDENANIVKTQFRKNDAFGIKERTTNYTPTGYLNKKGCSPLYNNIQEDVAAPHYPWPVIRMAELYLNLAEAYASLGRIDDAVAALTPVRARAGLDPVDEAFRKAGLTLDQAAMVRMARQERTVELYLEGHRFWDVRRWKEGDKYFNVRPRGMNYNGATDAEFFRVTEVVVQRKFSTPMHYLMPIPKDDINKNERKFVQNPGY